MYAIVLATALTAGGAAPELHFRGGCYGCYGGNAFSSCLGCYGGCYGCGGGGCFGAACYGGCYGGCYGCGGGCFGSGAGWTYYEAYGGFGGCGGCFGGCFGGCTGYYGGAAPTYFAPAAGGGAGMHHGGGEEAAAAPATVVVKAPLGATVKVNGQVATRRTAEETFRTPALRAGRTFAYNFEASLEKGGQVVTSSKRITVQANGRAVVDFTDLGTEAAVASAKVTVVLPKGAKLYVNDVAYAGDGTQTFDTPKLAKGKRFYYTVRAESTRDGRPVSESRRVPVEAGKEVTVDFTAAASEVLTASR